MSDAQETHTFETGSEPEFFITDIVRCEPASDGTMRVAVAAKRGGRLVTQFTVVGSTLDLIRMAKQVAAMADVLIDMESRGDLALKAH